MPSRDDVLNAFEALFTKPDMPFKTVSRKLKLWDNVQTEDRPALFILKTGENALNIGPATPTKTTLEVKIFIYTTAKEVDVPSTLLDSLLDAVDAAMAPDVGGQRLSLGGLVYHTWRDGSTLFIPGDLEGDGIAVIPVKILVPSFT